MDNFFEVKLSFLTGVTCATIYIWYVRYQKSIEDQFSFPNFLSRPIDFKDQKYQKLNLRLSYIPTWAYYLFLSFYVRRNTK